jgi:predicted enzyme related to lactoylglutathione lyase
VTEVEALFAAVPVSVLSAAVDWYSRLFGRPPDVVVHDDEVMWRVTEAAWFYVVVDHARGGQGVVTLAVGDLDASLTQLAERGLVGAPVVAVGTAGRRSVQIDPDGNTVALVEISG